MSSPPFNHVMYSNEGTGGRLVHSAHCPCRPSWCENCGDSFDSPERDCPNPSPGEPYVHCGRGGHMFSLHSDPAKVATDEGAEPCSGDLTPRDLAQRVVDGLEVSSAAYVDIARALLAQLGTEHRVTLQAMLDHERARRGAAQHAQIRQMYNERIAALRAVLGETQ